jgi:hypothetical protein
MSAEEQQESVDQQEQRRDRRDQVGSKQGSPLSSLLEGYITEKQLAELLGRTIRTLQLWRKERTGPPVTKIGATTFYEIEGVRAWLRSKSQPMPRAARK